MSPGRELDALIAEKVMGWKLVDYESGMPTDAYEAASKDDGYAWEGDPLNREAWQFKPSTDIAAAWEVVEHVRRVSHLDVFSLLGPSDESKYWFAGFEKKWHGRSYGSTFGDDVYKREGGDTAPHAICLAALKAVGG